MTPSRPPRALALLEYLLPGEQALAGDLLEASRDRSRVWLWRQVLLAVPARALFEIRMHPRASAEGLLVSSAMLTIIGFHALVVASLINHLIVLTDTSWIAATGRYADWQLYSLLPSFAAAAAAGRGISSFHRDHRIAAVLAFSASATLAAFLNLYLFVPNVLLQPFVPYAALQTAIGMVFIAGLFAGIASRAECESLTSS